ncbi:MAG: winged helix-turn-helix transcriptional regulator, partial [Chloroflexota bacterium]
VAKGVLTRRMFHEIPPRVEYELTEKGQAAVPIVEALRRYGERWLRDAVDEADVEAVAADPSRRSG